KCQGCMTISNSPESLFVWFAAASLPSHTPAPAQSQGKAQTLRERMAGDSAVRLLALSGLFPVYKPKGPTSAQVVAQLKGSLLKEAGLKEYVKKRKQTLKIGHGGTLDSSASGVLVIGIGDGTKMLSTMLAGSKKYTTVGELGKATDTLDASGTVTEEKPYDHITKEDLEGALKLFTGNIMQVPPLFSALKRDGKRLSCLLRDGAEVEAKPARPVTVYQLSLRDFQPPVFTLDVECGGGFYVRSLVNDLGKALKSCASVKELVRTKQGPFTLEDHTLKEEDWNISRIAQALQEYGPLLPAEPGNKRLKKENCHYLTESRAGST
uniref:Pseudouridylate synthase TRUB1 n=1 Tax=Xenopus tropicalis TaxID=8364 RepID=F7E5E4_XENTR